MGDREACLACKFLRRQCREWCGYALLFRSCFNVPRFQIGDAASPTDRQQIEDRLTESTKYFETKSRIDEPAFGATGVLIGLDLRMRDEISRFNTIVGMSRFFSIRGNVVYVSPPGTENHFVLEDAEILKQQHLACPVCMYLPRKCGENCPSVRFFEAGESADYIRKFYKLLLGPTAVLPDHSDLQPTDDIADIRIKALEFEDKARLHDSVYGITGIILSSYRDWWNLNHQLNLVEREQQHRSVQNLSTGPTGSSDISTDKGKEIVTPESTNVAHDECSTYAKLMDMEAKLMDVEDVDESLYSREEVLGKYMEYLHECSAYASILQLPQEWNYSFRHQQGEPSNSSPLSSVPHRMNQPSADQLRNATLLQRQQQLHRVSQQTQQQIPENVPQNVASQLQQLAAPSLSQQAASSSSRTATSSQQGLSSSTGTLPKILPETLYKPIRNW